MVWIWREGVWIRGKGSASKQRESASKGDGVCMQGEGGLHQGGIGSASVGQWRGSASSEGTLPSSRYIWYYGIWSMSGWYTHYCNAFLCFKYLTKISHFWRLKFVSKSDIKIPKGNVLNGQNFSIAMPQGGLSVNWKLMFVSCPKAMTS